MPSPGVYRWLTCGLLAASCAAAQTRSPTDAHAPLRDRSYDRYTELIDDYAAALAERDLVDRLLATQPKGLLIRFPRGSEARARVELQSGSLHYVADERDELHLPDKREWRRENPRILLSEEPLDVTLDFGS